MFQNLNTCADEESPRDVDRCLWLCLAGGVVCLVYQIRARTLTGPSERVRPNDHQQLATRAPGQIAACRLLSPAERSPARAPGQNRRRAAGLARVVCVRRPVYMISSPPPARAPGQMAAASTGLDPGQNPGGLEPGALPRVLGRSDPVLDSVTR
jgi:hypothetical protein